MVCLLWSQHAALQKELRQRKAKKIKRKTKEGEWEKMESSEFKLIKNEHAQFGHAFQLRIIS